MYSWSQDLEAAAPYRITLTPGSGTVPRGADQLFTATLSGFTADDAVLLVRKGDATAFERVPLLKGEDGTFEGMVFDLDAKLEFLAEAAGVRSPTFTLEVVDLPYAQRIDLEYHFPAHTGLEPRTVEDAGDIAVLVGTEVRVTVTPTMPTPGRADHAARVHERAAGRCRRRHADRALRCRQGRLLPRRPPGARRRDDHGLAAVRHRRARRHGAHGRDLPSPAATPTPRRSRSSSSRRGPTTTSACADSSWSTRSTAAPRRPCRSTAAPSGSRRSPPVTRFYLEELGVAGGRRGELLRARQRQRRQRRQAGDQRHLLPAHPAVRQGLQAGDVDGRRRRRRRWRRRRGRRAVGTAAPDHRRHLQRAAREEDD